MVILARTERGSFIVTATSRKYPKHWRHARGSPEKDWVKYPVNKRSKKFIQQRTHIEEGDTVMVMEGRDEGKIGEVLEVNKVHLHCTVKDCNMHYRSYKPLRANEELRRKWTEAWIPISSVMLYNKDKEMATRMAWVTLQNGVVCRKMIDGDVLLYPSWYTELCNKLEYNPDGTPMDSKSGNPVVDMPVIKVENDTRDMYSFGVEEYSDMIDDSVQYVEDM